MPRSRSDRRVLGPYRERGGAWRIVVVEQDGGRSSLTFASEPAAARSAEKIRAEWHRLDEIIVGEAIKKYLDHLKSKGNKAKSYTETIRRLRLFFPDDDTALPSLTKAQCAELYARFASGRSVDYARNTLAEARTFLGWCIAQGWLRANPLDGVRGTGRRRAGKAQLTGDEARKWLAEAQRRIDLGDDGALAAAMLLTMALRQGEVTARRVRDLDLDASVLRVADAKTRKAERPRHVPEMLRPALRRLVDGRPAESPLFIGTDRDGLPAEHTPSWLRSVCRRIARAAGTPYVCPHGLRGTAATLATLVGVESERVADYLSHESASTTRRHYVAPGTSEIGQVARGLRVLTGGRK